MQYEARSLEIDALSCARCSTPMVVLALISVTGVVKHILDHLGLPSSVPPVAPPRGLFNEGEPFDPPQDEEGMFDPSSPESDEPNDAPKRRALYGHTARPP